MAKKNEIPVLTKFVLGETSFVSRGFSELKVSEDGKAKAQKIPIKSMGLVELQGRLQEGAPRPPEREIFVKKDSELGVALGLKDDGAVIALDTTDIDYRKEMEKFNLEFTWTVVIHALDVDWVYQDGKEITDTAVKKEALQNSGITGHHLDQLMLDIRKLTTDQEVSADFLLRTGSGSLMPS